MLHVCVSPPDEAAVLDFPEIVTHRPQTADVVSTDRFRVRICAVEKSKDERQWQPHDGHSFVGDFESDHENKLNSTSSLPPLPVPNPAPTLGVVVISATTHSPPPACAYNAAPERSSFGNTHNDTA